MHQQSGAKNNYHLCTDKENIKVRYLADAFIQSDFQTTWITLPGNQPPTPQHIVQHTQTFPDTRMHTHSHKGGWTEPRGHWFDILPFLLINEAHEVVFGTWSLVPPKYAIFTTETQHHTQLWLTDSEINHNQWDHLPRNFLVHRKSFTQAHSYTWSFSSAFHTEKESERERDAHSTQEACLRLTSAQSVPDM